MQRTISQHKIIRDGGTFRNDDDAVADEEVHAVVALEIVPIDELDTIAEGDVFVEDGLLDETVFSYGMDLFSMRMGLFVGGRVVAHDIGVLNDGSPPNDRILADERVGDLLGP